MRFLVWTISEDSTLREPIWVKSLIPMWLSRLLKIEVFLTEYEEGIRKDLSVDTKRYWDGYDTFQTDIELQRAEEGGHLQFFGTKDNPDKLDKHATLFGKNIRTYRPDIMPSRMTKVKQGKKLNLTIKRFVKSKTRNPVTFGEGVKCYDEAYLAFMQYAMLNIQCANGVEMHLGKLVRS